VCTEEAVQRVKCEKTAEQAVLKVEVKTEVEEDRDQSQHEVRDSFPSPICQARSPRDIEVCVSFYRACDV
jgi:hypothetical protein